MTGAGVMDGSRAGASEFEEREAITNVLTEVYGGVSVLSPVGGLVIKAGDLYVNGRDVGRVLSVRFPSMGQSYLIRYLARKGRTDTPGWVVKG